MSGKYQGTVHVGENTPCFRETTTVGQYDRGGSIDSYPHALHARLQRSTELKISSSFVDECSPLHTSSFISPGFLS